MTIPEMVSIHGSCNLIFICYLNQCAKFQSCSTLSSGRFWMVGDHPGNGGWPLTLGHCSSIFTELTYQIWASCYALGLILTALRSPRWPISKSQNFEFKLKSVDLFWLYFWKVLRLVGLLYVENGWWNESTDKGFITLIFGEQVISHPVRKYRKEVLIQDLSD